MTSSGEVRPQVSAGTLLQIFWPAILVFAALLWIFRSTLLPMIDLWIEVETYTHGFVIFPISLWMIWERRRQLASERPKADFRLLPLLLGSLFLWLAGEVAAVQVVTQYALVAMLISGVMLVSGIALSRKIVFPLLFLFLAVPFGESLVPPMMEFTADFTVGLLRLSGIPVYRDGLMFSIPSGNWSVVEACSGVRYIIASVTLGVLFAYLNYHSLLRRAIFILVSALVPIIANGLRAYIIVMIGHMSDMQLATGVDHLIYGWLFFGLVMLILFSIGAIWRQEDPAPAPAAAHADAGGMASFPGLTVGGILAAMVIGYAGQLYANSLGDAPEHARPLQFTATTALPDGWRTAGDGAELDWMPTVVDAEDSASLSLVDPEGEPVKAVIHFYPLQSQGKEVVNARNTPLPPVDSRRIKSTRRIETGSTQVMQTRVFVQGKEFLVWQWYRVSGWDTANPYAAKAYEVIGKIFRGRGDGAILSLATPVQGDEKEGLPVARQRLEQARTLLSDDFDTAVDQAAGA